MKVFKYDLQLPDGPDLDICVELPMGSVLLHIASQNNDGQFQAWFLVDPDETKKSVRRFRVYGTGHQVADPPRGTMLCPAGTALSLSGRFVVHFFEVRNLREMV